MSEKAGKEDPGKEERPPLASCQALGLWVLKALTFGPGGGCRGESAGERSLAGLHGWTFRSRGSSRSLTLWGPQRLFSVAFWSRGWGLAEAERDLSAPCMGNA